jgi:mono/diheme cytochrome c family protein
MRSDFYQILLIAAGVIVTALFGVFFYREIFPEYKIYQQDYVALEEFRSTYTKQPVIPFQMGIKQIVMDRDNNNGPAIVDRCISCHVAMQIPYFSPTKIATDLNGNMVYDEKGRPVQIPNEDFIWQKLDEKIAELRDPQLLAQLTEQGDSKTVKKRLSEAEGYEKLKGAQVGDQTYDVTKVLVMHPLIGNETRPFEFHSLEEYGCTSCHSGNGRGLVTDRAHGPVFDGQYEEEFEGHVPEFTEPDPQNDPRFARMFNAKPGSRLIFQTTPLLVGPLVQSKCMNCHHTSDIQLDSASSSAGSLAEKREKKVQIILNSYENDKKALIDLLKIDRMITQEGYEPTLKYLKTMQSNFALPELELQNISQQIKYLENATSGMKNNERSKKLIEEKINQDLMRLLGSQELVRQAQKLYANESAFKIDQFLKDQQNSFAANGALFKQGEALNYNQDLLKHARDVKSSFEVAVSDQKVISALSSDVDELTRNYQRGKELYFSQACYACHRIAGLTRGGVGPELTQIGNSYPWYIKQSIVWPQADLPSSTMPNMRLDHMELEDLMTFLLAQKGGNRAVAETAYQADLMAWEGGKKLPWEKPIPPSQIYDLNYAMTIFATEGCASCHRLQGYTSNVGFNIEKEPSTFDQLYEKQHWFKQLFPEVIHISYFDEELPGSQIVAKVEKHAKEIDDWIGADVKKDGLLEEIDRKHPQVIESMYSNFRFASRAKDKHYTDLIKNEHDPEIVAHFKSEWQAWKERVNRVLMMYIQTYGLGRLIGPHLNWSGIYRSDQWLMEHFRNPTGHVPRSIMPIFPFDDTKFYALTNMLDQLAIRNRQVSRNVWEKRGFDPQEAFDTHCAQCHGISFHGNGIIAQWLYPLPKNLRSPDFLRNLTKEQVALSIIHGVKGTPMPPWGEVASDKPDSIQKLASPIPVLTESEIHYLVDWMFSSLPGGEVIKDNVPKWKYGPKDVQEELEKEGTKLIPMPDLQQDLRGANISRASVHLSKGVTLNASIVPIIESKPPKPVQEDDEIFETVSSASHAGGIDHYYIKKKYYTSYNIAQGKLFFMLNCAVCHGNEADGSGPRAEIMKDAKPRMLTDLDWIKSKDDIYLLRSIKYGVPGTSMTPWGDLTSSLQRLQLVMFIRTLSEEQDRRDGLNDSLYETYERSQNEIDIARIDHSKQLEELQKVNYHLKQQLTDLENSYEENQTDGQNALKVYQESLETERKIDRLRKEDEQLLMLKSELKRERDLYHHLGMTLLSKNVSDELLEKYFELIRLDAYPFGWNGSRLIEQRQKNIQVKAKVLLQAIVKENDEKILALEQEKKIINGKIASASRTEQMAAVQVEIDGFKKLKAKIITDVEEILRLQTKQEETLREINKA